MKNAIFLLSIILGLSQSTIAHSQNSTQELFKNFNPAWKDLWQKKSFTFRSNQFKVEQEGAKRFLKIESKNSATGLWRDVEIVAKKETRLSWKWKTQQYLNNMMEMKKNGDDFVGRVYVAFGEYSWLNRKKLNVICYVWASDADPGSIFPSPYADNVKIMVLRDEKSALDTWHLESRNLLEDYQKCFGDRPMPISAIGIMADTDNTNGECVSWFGEMELRN